MNLYDKWLKIAEYYNQSPEEQMTQKYREYLRWVCNQDFIIPAGQRTYFDKVDMQLSKHYNSGDYDRFMGAIREAKAAFSQA